MTTLLLAVGAVVSTDRVYASMDAANPGIAPAYTLAELASTYVWDVVSLALLMNGAALASLARRERPRLGLPAVVSGGIVVWTTAAWLLGAHAAATGRAVPVVWLGWPGLVDPTVTWLGTPTTGTCALDALSIAGPALLVLAAWLPALSLRTAVRSGHDAPGRASTVRARVEDAQVERNRTDGVLVARDTGVADELRRAATALSLVAVLCLVGLTLLAGVGGLGAVMGWYDADWNGLQSSGVALGLLAVVVAWVGAGGPRFVLLLVLGALAAQLVSAASWYGAPSISVLAAGAATVAWSHRRAGTAAARLLGIAPDARRTTGRTLRQP